MLVFNNVYINLKQMKKIVSSLVLLQLILVSCQLKEKNIKKDLPLYTLFDNSHTNIDFKNDLKETLYMNGLFYEYYYNGGGVAIGDFNNDDFEDVYFISNLKSNKMYLNQGNLKFKDITLEAGVKGKALFSTGVTTVDINADGLLDIYVCSSGQFEDPKKRRNELFVNTGIDKNGIPHFEEQSKLFGLDIEEFSTQATFFDYDKDDDMDMFLINHDIKVYGDHKLEEYKNTKGKLSGERLYRNDNGVFVDVTDQSGIINNKLGFGLGIAIGDVNNDGWPDAYVSHDFSGEDHLYINNKNGTFSEKIAESMRHMSFFSMGNDMADYNNDGWLDIISVDMVSEDNYGIKTSMSGMDVDRFYNHVNLGLHHQYMFNTLQTNKGAFIDKKTPLFSETAQLAGISSTDWSWAPLFFDMNNDGNQDLFVANGIKRDFRNNDFIQYHKKVRKEHSKNKTIDKKAYINHMMSKMPTRRKANCFFINQGDYTFSKKIIPSIDSVLTASNGASYADFDNDGDIDIIVNNMDDFVHLYKNNTSERSNNNYLKIKLKGSRGNFYGTGARVKVTYDSISQIREQYNTRGFQSSIGNILHFGIGVTKQVNKIEVTWNDGKTQILKNIKANKTVVLNHNKATRTTGKGKGQKIFKNITQSVINHRHIENSFNDFNRESLLPHKMSEQGPGFAVGDINDDGLDDFFIGGSLGFSGSLYLQNNDGTFIKDDQYAFKEDREYEDVDAEFLDVDSDGDLDLYVVSGGNERLENSIYYQDRLYVNNKGVFYS